MHKKCRFQPDFLRKLVLGEVKPMNTYPLVAINVALLIGVAAAILLLAASCREMLRMWRPKERFAAYAFTITLALAALSMAYDLASDRMLVLDTSLVLRGGLRLALFASVAYLLVSRYRSG